ncbi:MAG: hypothetical protein GKR94_33725 [Gammaproteobacteria bacterium]|nr:hypothetical protein [Gammaproteobacteria bacterium]
MDKFSGPEDLYDELVENSDENWLLGLVAFAVIEEQRIEWLKHQTKRTGTPPSPAEIQAWYQQQPEGVLLRARDTAEARLGDYSNSIVEEVVEELRPDIERDVIVNEIRSANRFWPQFGVNFAGGFASALVFSGLLVLMAFLVLNDISPVQFGAHAPVSAEENKDG